MGPFCNTPIFALFGPIAISVPVLSLDLWLSLSFHSVVCDFDSLSEILTVGFPHVVLLSTLTIDDPSNCQRGQIPRLDRSSRLLNTLCLKARRWCAKCSRHNLTPTGRYKWQKEQQTLWCIGGFKTPDPLSFTTSSVVNNSRPLGNWGRCYLQLKGPNSSNGASCPMMGSTGGLAWLRGMTISRNSTGPNCMPLGMRRRPPLVCFLTVGSQLGKDNSLLTIMLVVTMAYEWFCVW